MWRRFAMALPIALHTTGPCTVAHAQDRIPCDAFVRVGDGSWQAIATVLIPDHNFKVQEGSLWRPGATVMGMDIAATLEKACPNTPAGLPEGAAAPGAQAAPAGSQLPQASQVQTPQIPLARYADANGNIDIRQLTCGHLDDASPEETNLLLSWYGGWYNGAAKGHGINLARLRYAIRNVVDYCKINRDKSLLQVMNLMLK